MVWCVMKIFLRKTEETFLVMHLQSKSSSSKFLERHNINHPDQLLYTCYRCYNKELFTWYSSYNTESDWSYKIIITSLTVDVAAVSPENFKWSLSGVPRPQVDSEPLTLWGWWASSISWYGIIYLYVLYDAVHGKLNRINTYRHSRKKVVLTLRTFQCYNWEF